MSYRVFLATAKIDTEMQIAFYQEQVLAVAKKDNLTVEIVTARDHYERRFKVAGSWASWIREIVGVDPISNAPNFDIILVPGNGIVGKGTANIVSQALPMARRVALLTPETTVVPIVAVKCMDSTDYQTGYRLQTVSQ